LNVASEELFAALAARLQRKTFDRHPHHAGRRHARDVAAVRSASPAIIDLGAGDGPGRAFQLAFQIGLTEGSGIFEAIVGRAGPLDDTRAGSTESRWRTISRRPS